MYNPTCRVRLAHRKEVDGIVLAQPRPTARVSVTTPEIMLPFYVRPTGCHPSFGPSTQSGKSEFWADTVGLQKM